MLAVVSSVSLAAELDLLLHLIALPPGTTCHPSQDTLHTQHPRFTTGAVAALYAARVLSLSGGQHCSLHARNPLLGMALLDHLVAVDVFATALIALCDDPL